MFLYFVMHRLPHGLIGLLIAVIFFASMSTTASEINALASVSLVDIYKRYFRPHADDKHYVQMSRIFTVIWAIVAVSFALTLKSTSTLIELINVMGSLFYGVILGIFLLAFFAKKTPPTLVLVAAFVAEVAVLALHFSSSVSYLWYNVVGCLLTFGLAYGGYSLGIRRTSEH